MGRSWSAAGARRSRVLTRARRRSRDDGGSSAHWPGRARGARQALTTPPCEYLFEALRRWRAPPIPLGRGKRHAAQPTAAAPPPPPLPAPPRRAPRDAREAAPSLTPQPPLHPARGNPPPKQTASPPPRGPCGSTPVVMPGSAGAATAADTNGHDTGLHSGCYRGDPTGGASGAQMMSRRDTEAAATSLSVAGAERGGAQLHKRRGRAPRPEKKRPAVAPSATRRCTETAAAHVGAATTTAVGRRVGSGASATTPPRHYRRRPTSTIRGSTAPPPAFLRTSRARLPAAHTT